MTPIPKEKELYWFYADDRITKGTEYAARVIRVYPYLESDQRVIYKYDDYLQDTDSFPLMDLWIDNALEMFWILSPETDYIVEMVVPDLCPQHIFAARDLDGGWHSIITISDKEFGILDTTGEYHRKLHNQ